MASRYLLWDASAVIPYYVKEATRNNHNVHPRASVILESVRHHRTDSFCAIPNIVIAEVFASLDRECYSAWDPRVNKHYGGSGKTLDKRRHTSARKKFRNDIHNGSLFYQVEVNRYHVLALDLIAPIDKYMKHYRKKGTRSMGASDLLILAMGIHLKKIHGGENFAIVSADRRMGAILNTVVPRLRDATARKLGLFEKAEELRFGSWSSNLYPRVVDIERCNEDELSGFFGQWPLITRKTRHKPPKA